MTDQELLQAIRGIIKEEVQRVVKEEVRAIVKEELTPIHERLDKIEARLDSLEERMDRLEERMDRLEEDGIITRDGVNTLIAWAEKCGEVLELPLPRIADVS